MTAWLIVAVAAVIVTAAVLGYIRWSVTQQRRDIARILHEDRALSIVAPWQYAPCGCGWADTSPPTVRICTHHWLRLYVAADLHHMDREMSK